MMDFAPSTELSNYGIAKLLAESMKCGMRKIKFGLMAKSFIRIISISTNTKTDIEQL